MRRRHWIVLAAVPLVLLAAHFAYWRLVQRQLASSYAAWADGARAAGWTVEAGSTVGGGWPLAAELRVTNLVLSGGKAIVPGGIAWRSPLVTLRVGLQDPRALDVVAEGQQHVRLGSLPEIALTADQLQATLLLQSDAPPRDVDLLVNHLVADVMPKRGAAGRVTIGLLQGHADLNVPPGSSAGFSSSAEAVELPEAVKWPLGSRISSVALDGAISGALGRGGSQAEWAAAWRDSGGSLEVHRLAVGWGPLGVSATATLALDDQLQPMGAGTARLVGYAAALDALANNGTVSRSAVTAAKAVLSLLAPTPGDGEPSEVEVPLTLQYRTLSMRQVPLVRLPELDWPQP
jgi:hypothetical protein